MSILGTRPEIIRLSRVLPKIDKYTNHIFVYTGQSYDYELSGIFFKELGLRKPDYYLDVRADTIGNQGAQGVGARRNNANNLFHTLGF